MLIHSFIYSYNKNLWSTYYVPGPKDKEMNNNRKVISFMRRIFSWERLSPIIDCVMVALGVLGPL